MRIKDQLKAVQACVTNDNVKITAWAPRHPLLRQYAGVYKVSVRRSTAGLKEFLHSRGFDPWAGESHKAVRIIDAITEGKSLRTEKGMKITRILEEKVSSKPLLSAIFDYYNTLVV